MRQQGNNQQLDPRELGNYHISTAEHMYQAQGNTRPISSTQRGYNPTQTPQQSYAQEPVSSILRDGVPDIEARQSSTEQYPVASVQFQHAHYPINPEGSSQGQGSRAQSTQLTQSQATYETNQYYPSHASTPQGQGMLLGHNTYNDRNTTNQYNARTQSSTYMREYNVGVNRQDQAQSQQAQRYQPSSQYQQSREMQPSHRYQPSAEYQSTLTNQQHPQQPQTFQTQTNHTSQQYVGVHGAYAQNVQGTESAQNTPPAGQSYVTATTPYTTPTREAGHQQAGGRSHYAMNTQQVSFTHVPRDFSAETVNNVHPAYRSSGQSAEQNAAYQGFAPHDQPHHTEATRVTPYQNNRSFL
ncbi:hypothetical protein [Brevibacillus dissolubilis]|uniref:hypothetical protein n=1 Tax=Brevibacillus dissolubilis TaxID=1844116 RepID=UPI0011177387|nr:hypothetical protein [Brevibacillus dissolubilis]